MCKLKPGDLVLFDSKIIMDNNKYIVIEIYANGKSIIQRISADDNGIIWKNRDVDVDCLVKIS